MFHRVFKKKEHAPSLAPPQGSRVSGMSYLVNEQTGLLVMILE